MNSATDERASARIRFLWNMSHLLCGSALEWVVLFRFRARRELFVTGLVTSLRDSFARDLAKESDQLYLPATNHLRQPTRSDPCHGVPKRFASVPLLLFHTTVRRMTVRQIDSRATQPRRVPAAGLPGKALVIPDSAAPCAAGPRDPWAAAARTAPGILLQTDASHRLSIDAVNLSRVPWPPLGKDNCRELVTPPQSSPLWRPPTLPKGGGKRRCRARTPDGGFAP